jgi:hypothetical protein
MSRDSSMPAEIEVFAVQRRRRFSAEEKQRLVHETFQPGMSVSLVARATGVTAWLVSRSIRYFFVLLALFGIFMASIVFVPKLLKVAAGTAPFAWVLNIHGALMGTWLALFLAQAILASTGRLALHRKLGTFGVVLGFLVWASMVLVELRRKVVYPLDPALSDAYDWDLPGIYVYTMFLIFLIGAIYQRRRRPAWHKRFMLFATFVALQAAEQRIVWLPRFAPGYWTDVIYLDVCLLLPLIAYDYFSAKRLHAATIAASCMLLGAQGVVLLVWENPGWRDLAYRFTVALRSIF